MADGTLEERLTRLELTVEQLLRNQAQDSQPSKPWWEEISGIFKDDPLFDEAERLGREWRDSQTDNDTDLST